MIELLLGKALHVALLNTKKGKQVAASMGEALDQLFEVGRRQRRKNMHDVLNLTGEVPIAEHVEPDEMLVLEVLEWSSRADGVNVQQLFARLLAAHCDATKKDLAHRSYVQVLAGMNELDAALFREIDRHENETRQDNGILTQTPFADVYSLGPAPAVTPSLENLVRLGVCAYSETAWDDHGGCLGRRPSLRPTKCVALTGFGWHLACVVIGDEGREPFSYA